MVGRIYHVGLIVSDLDRSIAFYRDILELEFQGEIFMEGEETDKMFRKENCKARVAYLNGSKVLEASPVELIQFVDSKIHKEQSDLPDKPASDITSDDVASAVAFYMGQATDLNDKGLTMVHELAKYIFDNSASEERSDDHW